MKTKVYNTLISSVALYVLVSHEGTIQFEGEISGSHGDEYEMLRHVV
jgi:hypothetical protein